MKAKAYLFNLLMFFFCLQAGAEEIKIYTWEEYISEQVIEQFEKETGHTIKLVFFESEQLRDEVVTTERAVAYDLFIIDAYTLNLYSQIGIAKNLTHADIPNKSHISKDAISHCGDWGIPYAWGTIGIGYRESRFDAPVTSWSQVFSLSKEGYKFVIPSDDIDTIGIALLSLGKNPMTNDERELRQAYQRIQDSQKDILEFRTATGYALEMKQNSKMDAAVIYSGETYTLAEATGQDDWIYAVPEEGTIIWYECFAAPSEKPLSEASVAFLNFINRPEIAALNAEEIWLATTNKSALDHADSEYLEDKELFPDKDILNRSYHYEGISNASMKIRARIVSIIDK